MRSDCGIDWGVADCQGGRTSSFRLATWPYSSTAASGTVTPVVGLQQPPQRVHRSGDASLRRTWRATRTRSLFSLTWAGRALRAGSARPRTSGCSTRSLGEYSRQADRSTADDRSGRRTASREWPVISLPVLGRQRIRGVLPLHVASAPVPPAYVTAIDSGRLACRD